VLDAERNLFRADLELVRAQREEIAAAVALFRALGGGWSPPR
jgi:multidrug efflux system outer membrane protein